MIDMQEVLVLMDDENWTIAKMEARDLFLFLTNKPLAQQMYGGGMPLTLPKDADMDYFEQRTAVDVLAIMPIVKQREFSVYHKN